MTHALHAGAQQLAIQADHEGAQPEGQEDVGEELLCVGRGSDGDRERDSKRDEQGPPQIP